MPKIDYSIAPHQISIPFKCIPCNVLFYASVLDLDSYVNSAFWLKITETSAVNLLGGDVLTVHQDEPCRILQSDEKVILFNPHLDPKYLVENYPKQDEPSNA